jgi:hypothetical protein
MKPMTHEPTREPDDPVEVLRTVWGAGAMSSDELDAAFGPQKACKNMKHVSFDGMAEPGSDLRAAWRERLEREGKLNTSGGTIRDLVLGS